MAGLLARLFGRTVEQRALPANYAPGWNLAHTPPGMATRHVSPHMAENLAPVMAAVNVIASALASLPPIAYRRQGRGRVELADHWLADLLRSPSAHLTWPEFCENLVADALLNGNALAEVVADASGRVVALEPIPWARVAVSVLPSGRIAYDISQGRRARRLLEGEVLHLRDRSDDGIVGRARLSRAALAVSNSWALQEMSSATWANAMRLGGYVQLPDGQYFTDDAQRELARAKLDAFKGALNSGRWPVLEAGWRLQQLQIDAESAETLASRKFSISEVARIFQVPPPLLQDYSHSTFTNSQQASLWFAQHSLLPWARKLEAAIGRSVIGPESELSVELDLSALTRGDFEARWRAWAVARQHSILDVNEIRDAEGFGPRESGEIAPAAAE